MTLGSIGDVKVEKAPGVGFGDKEVKNLFSNGNVKVSSSVTKINGLVNEYISQLGSIKEKWTMGLGKYLIAKLEVAMQGKGALEVDKIEGKSGNYVFMNGHACGLSSRLSDFEHLAVRMSAFEKVLATLTATSTFGKKAHTKISVGPPEWDGK